MPETNTATGTKAELSFKPENFVADMAKIAEEQGIKPDPEVKNEESAVIPEPIVTPTTPAQPEPEKVPAAVTPEATKVEVPEKFKTPDGQIDVAKVEKSTINAEETLAKYLEKEKELKRKINEVKQKDNAYLNPPAAIAPIPEIIRNIPFEQKVANDIAAQGIDPNVANALSPVMVRLFIAAEESAFERAQEKIRNLEMINADNSSKAQVEAIGKKDPWVYTPEGLATLTKVLDEQPYMWQAKEPYKAAYLYHKGMQNVVSQSSPQVLTPTPTARPSAPVPTGQAANQTNTSPELMFDKLTPDQKNEFIRKCPANEQEKWFIRMGYPAFNSR